MKLYETNSYIFSFETIVDDVIKNDKGIGIILKETAFYPEAGGQPCDLGFIGELKVIEVKEKEGKIIHYVEDAEKAVYSANTKVHCSIDKNRRLEHMQAHTGEHILSGIVKERFNYENVGFHIGAEDTTIDISGTLTETEIIELEEECNRVIRDAVKVNLLYPDSNALSALDYRSKKAIDGQVRIVEVDGVDLCACCGTHLNNTLEVRMLKITSAVNYKKGMRLTIYCGDRLLKRMNTIFKASDNVAVAMSVKPAEIANAVGRLKSDNLSLKASLSQKEKELIEYNIEKIIASSKSDNVISYQENASLAEISAIANGLVNNFDGIIAIYTDNYYTLASKNKDVREITKQLNSSLDGKGGGKPQSTQGSYNKDKQEMQAFLSEIITK